MRVASRLQASCDAAFYCLLVLELIYVLKQAKAVFYLVDTINTPELVQQ